jgi:hypothetical protein
MRYGALKIPTISDLRRDRLAGSSRGRLEDKRVAPLRGVGAGGSTEFAEPPSEASWSITSHAGIRRFPNAWNGRVHVEQ